jgi:hypothetical protein
MILGPLLDSVIAEMWQHHRMYARGGAVAETRDTDF